MLLPVQNMYRGVQAVVFIIVIVIDGHGPQVKVSSNDAMYSSFELCMVFVAAVQEYIAVDTHRRNIAVCKRCDQHVHARCYPYQTEVLGHRV